jgi:hypothetical protein
MKVHTRTHSCAAAILATMLVLPSCGIRQTIASKSAAAYDEAKKKGIPIQEGAHGGHEAASEPPAEGPMAGMDQPSMPGMPAMDHSNMNGMQHGSTPATHDMPGMDHSNMSDMQHGSTSATHDMPGMDHSKISGIQRGSMTGMSGMHHGSSPATPLVIAPPSSNAEIARTEPAVTLRPDDFDAPAPASMDDAARATAGGRDSMEQMPKSPAPAGHDQPAPQPPAHHYHGGREVS